MCGDVSDRVFSLKEELKILCNEGFRLLHGPGGDALVGVLQRLTPLQGAKAGIATKDNSIKDCNKWMGSSHGGDVLGHPQCHFVCDHVAAFRY